MEETLNTDIIDGKMINWEKLSNEEIKELKSQAESKEKEIIQKLVAMFTDIVEE